MNRQWLLAALLLSALPLSAADMKLGYVYSDQIIKDYKGMTEPNAALAKEKTAFRQKADSLYGVQTKAKADFEAQKLLLSEEGKAAKNAEIDELQRHYDDYVREVYGPNGKLEQKTQELMGPIIQKIRDAVEKIAKNESYGIVFDAAESKMAILYAETGSNITRDVLDEINREFVPVTPTGVVEKHYAVCPLTELNSEAQEANAGEQSRALIYEIMKNQSKTQMVANGELSSALMAKGATGKANITEELVYAVGKDVQADYIFYGSVTKSGKKHTIVLKIADPRLNKTFPEETGTANRPEELKQTLGNLVQSLVKKLPQE